MDERLDGNDGIVGPGDGRIIALKVETAIALKAATPGFALRDAELHTAQGQPVVRSADAAVPVKDRSAEAAAGIEHLRVSGQTRGFEQPRVNVLQSRRPSMSFFSLLRNG